MGIIDRIRNDHSIFLKVNWGSLKNFYSNLRKKTVGNQIPTNSGFFVEGCLFEWTRFSGPIGSYWETNEYFQRVSHIYNFGAEPIQFSIYSQLYLVEMWYLAAMKLKTNLISSINQLSCLHVNRVICGRTGKQRRKLFANGTDFGPLIREDALVCFSRFLLLDNIWSKNLPC